MTVRATVQTAAGFTWVADLDLTGTRVIGVTTRPGEETLAAWQHLMPTTDLGFVEAVVGELVGEDGRVWITALEVDGIAVSEDWIDATWPMR